LHGHRSALVSLLLKLWNALVQCERNCSKPISCNQYARSLVWRLVFLIAHSFFGLVSITWVCAYIHVRVSMWGGVYVVKQWNCLERGGYWCGIFFFFWGLVVITSICMCGVGVCVLVCMCWVGYTTRLLGYDCSFVCIAMQSSFVHIAMQSRYSSQHQEGLPL